MGEVDTSPAAMPSGYVSGPGAPLSQAEIGEASRARLDRHGVVTRMFRRLEPSRLFLGTTLAKPGRTGLREAGICTLFFHHRRVSRPVARGGDDGDVVFSGGRFRYGHPPLTGQFSCQGAAGCHAAPPVGLKRAASSGAYENGRVGPAGRGRRTGPDGTVLAARLASVRLCLSQRFRMREAAATGFTMSDISVWTRRARIEVPESSTPRSCATRCEPQAAVIVSALPGQANGAGAVMTRSAHPHQTPHRACHSADDA